jgi:hypothetical protein
MAKGRNKGEYSELLAFLRILHEGRIQLADRNGEPRSVWLKVVSVSQPRRPEFSYTVKVDSVEFGGDAHVQQHSVKRSEIKELADALFSEIKDAKGASFECKSAEIACDRLKLSALTSSSDKKSDIILRISSAFMDGEILELGFSIKSEIGGLPTLLNAGATRFKYRVSAPPGCDAFQVQEDLPRDEDEVYPGPMKLLPALGRAGVSIEFDSVEHPVFEQNLKMIDTAFPWILSTILKHAYVQGETDLSRLIASEGLISEVASRLVLPPKMVRILIRHKIKDLLRQSALGMMPSRPWSGEVEAHGGWIIVKKDGSVVCFNLANDDQFREFLLDACKIETPGMTRHKSGYLYRQAVNESPALNLSLQLRMAR